MPRIPTKRRFSVVVGGDEVNDFFLTKEEADTVYKKYLSEGYDDVHIIDMEKIK